MPYQVKWKGDSNWWLAADGYFEKRKDAEAYVKNKRNTQIYLIRWKVEKIADGDKKK